MKIISKLLALTLFLSLGFFAVKWFWGDQPPDETWYCYDTSGHPVGGVLIVCDYGLAGSNDHSVNFRFADASGKIVLGLDPETLRGLGRSYICVYSRQLRNGDSGLGQRWHVGQPIPAGPVYFDEWNNKIYITPAGNDRQAWHTAIGNLDYALSYRRYPVGGAKLDKELSPFLARERQDYQAAGSPLPFPLPEPATPGK